MARRLRLLRTRWPGPLALASTLAALCWLGFLAEGLSPVLGDPVVHQGLLYAAWVVTGAASVLLGGRLVLSVVLGSRVGPTGLQRVLVYLMLTFLASAVVLRRLGFDPTAVLATSALLTAAVGLAMQPTLSSMFSGIALHLDRAVRVGDAIILNGQRWRVQSLSWRSVLARASDGRTIVMPNAPLAGAPMIVAPSDQPMRLDCMLHGPADVAPGQIAAWMKEAVAAFPQVEPSKPMTVLPMEYDPIAGAMRYRVRFWVRNPGLTGDIEPEIVARAWYVFQRHRIALPRAAQGDGAPGAHEIRARELPRDALARLIEAALPDCAPAGLLDDGEMLLFAPGERLVPPRWAADRCLVLLDGDAVAFAPPSARERLENQYLPGALPALEARRQVLVDALAREIGPYAEFAVHRASLDQPDIGALRAALTGEIDDGPGRHRFMDATRAFAIDPAPLGTLIAPRRRGDGSLTAMPDLVARTEVAVLAVTRGALEAMSPRTLLGWRERS